MATATALISIEEYLRTIYHPDRDTLWNAPWANWIMASFKRNLLGYSAIAAKSGTFA